MELSSLQIASPQQIHNVINSLGDLSQSFDPSTKLWVKTFVPSEGVLDSTDELREYVVYQEFYRVV